MYVLILLSLYMMVVRCGAPRGGVMRAGVLSASLLMCAPAPALAKKRAAVDPLRDARILVDGTLRSELRDGKAEVLIDVSKVWFGDKDILGAELKINMSRCGTFDEGEVFTVALDKKYLNMSCVAIRRAGPSPYWGRWDSFPSLLATQLGAKDGPLGVELVSQREQASRLQERLIEEVSALAAGAECPRPEHWTLSLIVSGDGRWELGPASVSSDAGAPTSALVRWMDCLLALSAKHRLTTRFEGAAVSVAGRSFTTAPPEWFVAECGDSCYHSSDLLNLSYRYARPQKVRYARVRKSKKTSSAEIIIEGAPRPPAPPLALREIRGSGLNYISFGAACLFEGLDALVPYVLEEDDALILAECAARWTSAEDALEALARVERRAAALNLELYGRGDAKLGEISEVATMIKVLAMWRGGDLDDLEAQWRAVDGRSGRIGLLRALSTLPANSYPALALSPWTLQARGMLLHELHPHRRADAIALLRAAVASVREAEERRRYLDALKAIERVATPQELAKAELISRPWLTDKLEDGRFIRAKEKRKRVLTEREERGQEQAQANLQQAQVRAVSAVFAARVAGLKAVDTQPAPADPERGLRDALIVAIAIASLLAAALLIRRASR
jgi:hypothetical protein